MDRAGEVDGRAVTTEHRSRVCGRQPRAPDPRFVAHPRARRTRRAAGYGNRDLGRVRNGKIRRRRRHAACRVSTERHPRSWSGRCCPSSRSSARPACSSPSDDAACRRRKCPPRQREGLASACSMVSWSCTTRPSCTLHHLNRTATLVWNSATANVGRDHRADARGRRNAGTGGDSPGCRRHREGAQRGACSWCTTLRLVQTSTRTRPARAQRRRAMATSAPPATMAVPPAMSSGLGSMPVRGRVPLPAAAGAAGSLAPGSVTTPDCADIRRGVRGRTPRRGRAGRARPQRDRADARSRPYDGRAERDAAPTCDEGTARYAPRRAHPRRDPTVAMPCCPTSPSSDACASRTNALSGDGTTSGTTRLGASCKRALTGP